MRRLLSLLVVSGLAACSSAAGPHGTGTGAGGAGTGAETTGPATSSSGATGTTGATSSSGASSSSSGTGGGPPGGACAHPLKEYSNGNGSVTFYTFAMGAPVVNCSFQVTGQNPDVVSHVATGSGKYFGAMDTTDYASAAVCGACVEVTRDNAKKVVVTIVDQCPTCQAGHIDLSEQAFLQIGTMSEGYLGTGNGGAVGVISWRYVPCPVTENVSYVLKDAKNQFWNQILVQGHRYAIDKVEVKVNGQWVSAVRQSYNYWQAGNGDIGMPPYQVRVTDINGDVISDSLMLVAGDQLSSAQFPLCQ
jgi:expansin (peptidoglycan-binding protein)